MGYVMVVHSHYIIANAFCLALLLTSNPQDIWKTRTLNKTDYYSNEPHEGPPANLTHAIHITNHIYDDHYLIDPLKLIIIIDFYEYYFLY